MKADDIRALSTDEIRSKLDDAREAYFKLRFQYATGQLSDHSRLRQVRKDIARYETVLRQRELAAQVEGSEV
jgi:large subunit ribosomal protein L29